MSNYLFFHKYIILCTTYHIQHYNKIDMSKTTYKLKKHLKFIHYELYQNSTLT